MNEKAIKLKTQVVSIAEQLVNRRQREQLYYIINGKLGGKHASRVRDLINSAHNLFVRAGNIKNIAGYDEAKELVDFGEKLLSKIDGLTIIDQMVDDQAKQELENFVADTDQQLLQFTDLVSNWSTEEKIQAGESGKDVAKEFENRFGDAAKDNLKLLKWATGVAIVLAVSILGAAIIFSETVSYKSYQSNDLVLVLRSAARGFGLIVLAGLLTAAVGVIRAQLHLRERNLHRARVLDSLEGLLDTSQSAEERAITLYEVVRQITEFGDSGLIKGTSGNQTLPTKTFEWLNQKVSK